jgi:Protein of unknown function (DUF1579)
MTTYDAEAPPIRGPQHDRLAAFLGEWEAEGTSYGGTDQSGVDPRANGLSWESTHTGRWHTGEYFLVQEEKARLGGVDQFDTLSVMGIDPGTGSYFARSFENHGFYRHYRVAVEGNRWDITGDHERATITFSGDHRTQTIVWEWRPGDEWLPLCERTATRVDGAMD